MLANESEFERQFDAATDALAVKMNESLSEVRQALAALLAAESHLLNAAGKVYGTPDDDRITSLSMSVEDLECDLRKQIHRMERMI